MAVTVLPNVRIVHIYLVFKSQNGGLLRLILGILRGLVIQQQQPVATRPYSSVQAFGMAYRHLTEKIMEGHGHMMTCM